MLGYQMTNHSAAAQTTPATNRRASRAVNTNQAARPSGTNRPTATTSGEKPTILTSTVSSRRMPARTTPTEASATLSARPRRRRPGSGDPSGPSGRSSRRSCQTSATTARPMTRTRPAVRAVRTISPGGVATQACEPGSTAVTRAKAQSGARRNQRSAGPRIATAAAARARSHVQADAPCQSSARK